MTPEVLKQVVEALRLAPEPNRDDTVYYHWFRDDRSKALALLAAEQAKSPPDRERLAARMLSDCIDWDGTEMSDAEYPRAQMTCGQIREAAAALRLPAPEEVEAIIARLNSVKERQNLIDGTVQYWTVPACRDAIALLRRMSPVTAGEWQDISMAPKDGQPILLGCIIGDRLYWAKAGQWQHRLGWFTITGDSINGPTHFAPLPADVELQGQIAAAIRSHTTEIAAERDQALKIERLALAQVKEMTAVMDEIAAERDRLWDALKPLAEVGKRYGYSYGPDTMVRVRLHLLRALSSPTPEGGK